MVGKTKITTNHWPSSANDFIVFDMNENFILWDATLEGEGSQRIIEARRGEMIEDLMDEK